MRSIETAEDQLKKRSPDKEIRSRFKKKLSVYELMRIPLMYIDESGFAEDMPKTFGDAPEGRRCFGKHTWQAKQRTNAIGGLTGDSLLTATLFDCNINRDVFEAWLQQGLLPVLLELWLSWTNSPHFIHQKGFRRRLKPP